MICLKKSIEISSLQMTLAFLQAQMVSSDISRRITEVKSKADQLAAGIFILLIFIKRLVQIRLNLLKEH